MPAVLGVRGCELWILEDALSEQYRLMQGDCLELLKTLGDGSVDAVVTDPPVWIALHGAKVGLLRAFR